MDGFSVGFENLQIVEIPATPKIIFEWAGETAVARKICGCCGHEMAHADAAVTELDGRLVATAVLDGTEYKDIKKNRGIE